MIGYPAPRLPPPQSGADKLTVPTTPPPTLAATLAHERQVALAASAWVRLGGSAGFCLLLLGTWVASGRDDWRVYLVPTALHTLLAALVVVLRRRPAARRLVPFAALSDVALVFLVQLQSLPVSPLPAGVAGFSLGLFALIVSLNALALSTPVLYTTALASAVAEVELMRAADVGPGAWAAGVLVLLLLAAVMHARSLRLERVAVRLAGAEVERRLEQERLAHEEEARRASEQRVEEMRLQNERLVQLQHDKDTLTQLVVHDLRAPLTALLGNVDFVATTAEEQLGPAQRDALKESIAVTQRMNAMIGEILSIARLEQGQLQLRAEPLAAGELLTSLARMVPRLAPEKRLQVALELGAGLELSADRTLLTRALENVVSNAVRFSPAGGTIALSAAREDGELVLRVRNQGPAIAPELRARIFEKYQQGREARGGWGLGLYFCRLAVEAHDGRIGLEDAPGWSVSFALRLPVRPPARAAA